jgi:hypothetical protein
VPFGKRNSSSFLNRFVQHQDSTERKTLGFDESSGGSVGGALGLLADLRPIFFANVVVDMDGQVADIEAILAVPPRA